MIPRTRYFLSARLGALLCFVLMALIFILQGCGTSKPAPAPPAAPASPPASRPGPDPRSASTSSARMPVDPLPLRPGRRAPLRIVIDPGHGGESAGAVGVTKVLEKEITLQIALELAKLLKKNIRCEILLTRTVDTDVALVERTRIANDAQGTIFVSIHANASENQRRHGVEVYYLDNTDDEASLKLAARENDHPQSDEEQDLSFIVSTLR